MVLALGLPFFAMLLSRPLEDLRKGSAAVVSGLAAISSFILLMMMWILGGQVSVLYPWIASLGISFALRLDALSFLFSLLVTGIGGLILLYSRGYMVMEEDTGRFYAYMSLFMGSMLGLVLSGDLILLFLFWELTTISSFLLIGFHREEGQAIRSAIKALIITGLGGVALLAALLIMGLAVGSFRLGEVLASGEAIKNSSFYIPLLLLFLLAVAAKSAQFPLHIWLPDAMVAPTPVSAYLHSAAMVKAGIFLLVRFLPVLATPDWQALLIPLGTATMIVGGVQAIRAWELKRILAYSTISQLGLLASAFGVLSIVGQEAGLLHLLNHALLKASLFLVAGIVTLTTGLKDIRHLGGLGRRMPITAATCGLAAASLAGIPPLGGFLSKELYFEATLISGNPWMPWLAVLGGGLTFGYSIRFFYAIFVRKGNVTASKEPLSLAIPALILAALTLALGVIPSLGEGLVSPYVHGQGHRLKVLTAGGLLSPPIMSVLSAGLGLLILWRYEGLASFLERANSWLRRASPNTIFDGMAMTGRWACATLGVLLQNGSLRRYTAALLLFLGAVLVTPFSLPVPEVPAFTDVRDTVLALVVVAMVIFASLAAAVRDTLHAVLSLSGMGFLLAMTFMLLSAPDLAMTQILVEMVLLVIFLLVLHRIPFRALQPSRRRGPTDILLSLVVAVGVAYVVALSLSAFYFPSVALRYLDPTLVDLTGGMNVVNVVVTDFRAFDTLGEITVIGLASLAVYTLLRRWKAD